MSNVGKVGGKESWAVGGKWGKTEEKSRIKSGGEKGAGR